MYKLIAIDLDGTLLDDRKNVPEENIKVINKLIAKGYELVFATGRRYLAAKEFIGFFQADLIIIANNGNMVRHSLDDQLIDASYLEHKYLEDVLNYSRELDLHPVIHVNKYEEGIDMLCELEKDHKSYYNYVAKEDRCVRVDSFLDEELDILSIVYLGGREELAALEARINKAHPGIYQTYLMEDTYLSEALLEVVNPHSSKWKSILAYAESRGIAREEIIAIGDNTNDIEMVAEAGLGIAMKNGVAGLREVADLVTQLDNNQAGLAHSLEKVLDL